MTQFLSEHLTLILLGIAYFGVAVIETMPKPDDPRPRNAKLYQWLFDASHLIANKAIEKRPELASMIPQSPSWPAK